MTLPSYNDGVDRVGTFSSSTGGSATYGYDETDQVTSASFTASVYGPAQANETFAYDANGNRVMTNYVVSANNRITSDGVFNYEYDFEGARTMRTKISTGEFTEYAWDHRHRLTTITEKPRAAGAATKIVDYVYIGREPNPWRLENR